ncbi:DotA/TraY family protein [Salinimonas sp. HHU 13199]|uniref:DotA/TraY family protein n=1 Tax=Salinimonas profundi TaxID=2729140 RepID=A0ABR8LPL7_9ALTE|nr:DotA/TraY family protein [Salinimonas profundi]MBD3587558.1 DotA/TraY family protein [Salinimonas profundi]
MKNWCFITLTVLLFLISGKAVAQEEGGSDVYESEPIIENPNDLGVQVLRGVLGDVTNIISGGELPQKPDTVLGSVMLAWCGALAVVATLLVAFGGFKWFFGSIHSGKMNEQKLDSTGVPVRMVIALVSVVPLAAGYCFYQLVHIYLTGHSLSVANNLSDKATSFMSVGAFHQKTLPINSDEIAAQAFETLVCAHGINAAEGTASGETVITPSIVIDLEGTGDNATNIYGIKYGDESDSWFKVGGYSDKACGEYVIEFSEPDFRMTTDGRAENNLLNGNYAALQNLFNEMSKPAADFVNKVYISDADHEDLRIIKKQTKLAIENLAAEYNNAIRLARIDYANEKSLELEKPDSELPNYLKSTPSFLDNYSLNDIGFIGLGSTWWVDSIRTQAFTSMLTSMEVQASNIEDKALHHEDLTELWSLVDKVTEGRSGRLSSASTENIDYLSHLEDKAMSWLIGASLRTVNETNDPLFALMELGHEMIVTAETLIALLLTANITVEVSDNLSRVEVTSLPFIGTMLETGKAIATGTAEGMAKQIATGLMLLIALLLTMGVYLAFYLPTIPLMHWLGGVIGAFSAALEQIILAPIHGISHAFTDGHGFVGERAKQGYILAFGSFLRFPMLVISFIVVYPLLLMMGYITFLLWTPFAESMSSTTTTGIVSFFGLTAALIAVCVSVIERVFSIMHEINDKALRALGHGADSMGAQGYVHSGNQQFSTVQSTISKAPEGLGGVTPQGGNIPGPLEGTQNKDLK